MVNKGMFNLIRDVAEKRGLEFEEVLEVFGDSVAACSKKLEPGKNITIRVRFDVDKCEYYIEKLYKVVEELSEDQSEVEICEISLEDAKKIKRNAKVGEIIVEEVSNKDDRYSRVIVKSIGDTFNSNLINLERKKTYEYFKNYEHEMITATILKVQENKKDPNGAKNLILDLGKGTTTVLSENDLLPNEKLYPGDRISVYVREVKEDTKGPRVLISRTDRNLITRLMETNVPEIKDGIIEIKGIARDPGSRTKIAVYSHDAKVDPVGSCVGEAGCRINAVVDALNGEKIDIYAWSEDPEELVTEALKPANVTRVISVDPEHKFAQVAVADNQLSLAIGKNGQNVRLAVQSSGWKIDIKSTQAALDEGLMKL